jgi:hypothetical protein
MSAYTDTYQIKYYITSISQQIEVAVMHAAVDIQNEAVGTPDHANRIRWADWANANSQVAMAPFAWPVAMNPAIVTSITNDPTGASVLDSDVQFIINSLLDSVISDWVAANP